MCIILPFQRIQFQVSELQCSCSCRMRKALYYQSTSNHDLEFTLIQKTVARETAFKSFKRIEKAVKEKRRPFDDEVRLELLVLLNEIRETTFIFLEEVIQWQKMFVKAKRPTVMSEDYLLQMAFSTEFMNASPLKKHYNFSISRQNVFLLLMSTGKPKDPVEVTPRIHEELQKLADPNLVSRLIFIRSCHSIHVLFRGQNYHLDIPCQSPLAPPPLTGPRHRGLQAF